MARTLIIAFSITLLLALSNFVSYSLAPPRIARTKDGLMVATPPTPTALLVLLPRRPDQAAAALPMPDRTAREGTMQFLISMMSQI
jgi:hypothetical protein